MRKSKKQVAEEAKEAVGKLVEEAVKTAEEGGDRVPGKKVHGVKTPWMRSDVDKAFPLCSFTPGKTMPVTYNGVRYQLIEGVEMLVPTIVRDIYNESEKKMREAGRNLPQQGFPVTVNPGAGGLPAE